MYELIPEKNFLLGPPSSTAGSPIYTSLNRSPGLTRCFILAPLISDHMCFLRTFNLNCFSDNELAKLDIISFKGISPSIRCCSCGSSNEQGRGSESGKATSPTQIWQHVSAWSAISETGNSCWQVGNSMFWIHLAISMCCDCFRY